MKITDLKDYYVVASRPNPTQDRMLGARIQDVGVGAIKGLTDSTVQTARLFHAAGQGIQAAVDPTKTYQDIRSETSDSVLNPSSQGAKAVDSTLARNTPEEKAGDIAQILATVLYPIGKAGVAGGLMKGIGSRVSALKNDATTGVSNVSETIIDLIGGLDDKTKTALERTSLDRFQKFADVARKAMQDDRNRTPLEEVGDSVANALKTVKTKLSTIGEQKGEYAKINGIQGFSKQALSSANQRLQSFLNSRDLIDDDKAIVQGIVSRFKALGNTPSVGQVDRFIDFAQSKLYAGDKNLTVTLTGKTKGALKSFIGELNEAVKKQMPNEYQSLNNEYGRLIEFVGELNTKLGKESGNAGALVKRLFSPSDARTKELFDLLEKETGQDFFRDARVAKFVMDALGDVRQKSLLEEIPTSATGAVGKAVSFIKDKLSDPIDAAERYIKKTRPQDSSMKGANAIAGVQTDDEGDMSFNPMTAALGIALGGSLKRLHKDDQDFLAEIAFKRKPSTQELKLAADTMKHYGLKVPDNLKKIPSLLQDAMQSLFDKNIKP